MTKYLIGAAIGAGLMLTGTAFAKAIPSGTIIADMFGGAGSHYQVLKVTDGTTDCYVVNAQFPAISCVK